MGWRRIGYHANHQLWMHFLHHKLRAQLYGAASHGTLPAPVAVGAALWGGVECNTTRTRNCGRSFYRQPHMECHARQQLWAKLYGGVIAWNAPCARSRRRSFMGRRRMEHHLYQKLWAQLHGAASHGRPPEPEIAGAASWGGIAWNATRTRSCGRSFMGRHRMEHCPHQKLRAQLL